MDTPPAPTDLPRLPDGRLHLGPHVAGDGPVDQVQIKIVQLQSLHGTMHGAHCMVHCMACGGVRMCCCAAAAWRAADAGACAPAGAAKLVEAASLQAAPRRALLALSDLRQAWRTRAVLWSLFHALEQM